MTNLNETNQTAKHTPGPWEVGKIYSVRNKEHIPIVSTDGLAKYTVAITSPVNKQATEEDKANARLIAAAPELLEALVGACAIISTHVNMGAWEGEKEKEIYKNFWNKIESAITKATSTNPSNQSK